ncbi:MAG: AbrB/MazE/SpoVT family DNA-binding domain-containing protein [Nanoarchaeota archaeon]|nr:AbrB/MazE/SpoVT family DNA-binding domain-containing protein [Nanoarchaeota archaeon]
MKTKFVAKVKLTKQGQLTLPLEARKDLGIKIDTELYWYEYNGVLIVTKDLLNPKEIEGKIKRNK